MSHNPCLIINLKPNYESIRKHYHDLPHHPDEVGRRQVLQPQVQVYQVSNHTALLNLALDLVNDARHLQKKW